MAKAKEQTVAMIKGKEPLPEDRSREAAADIMSAIVHSTEFVDVVNLPNVGQIDNLPRGAVVETLGVINGLGFTPLTAGPLPEPIVNLVYPHASSQLMLVEAVLTGNREQAFDALRNEPVCSHLSFREIRQMGEELLAANKRLGQPSPLG
ncbi:MAG: hypothetical protein HQ546_06095 [Planctomycetes bacterium]|nr:hypothetical protein [Planctomycetota bacterium]